jgi:hypothetical protein
MYNADDISFMEKEMSALQESFTEIESLWGQVIELERCVSDSTLYVRQWLSDLAAHCPTVDSTTLTALMERINEAVRVPVTLEERVATAPGPKQPIGCSQRSTFAPSRQTSSVSAEKGRSLPTRALSKKWTHTEWERRQVHRLLVRLENTRFRTDIHMEAVLTLLWRNQPDGLYVHELMRETGMSRMQLNTYLHALVKCGLAEKYPRKGLVYALRVEQP